MAIFLDFHVPVFYSFFFFLVADYNSYAVVVSC